MPQNPGVWGIDIGQCALKAVRLEMIEGVVTATAFDYVEHPKILSQPDADPDQLTRESLEQFLSRNTLKGDQVAISVPGQSGIAFTAEKVAPLIEELSSRADFVILDSSPLLTLADSFLLARHSNDVLVVARQGQTKKEKAEAVRARLKVLGVKRVGVILTDSPSPESGGYYS